MSLGKDGGTGTPRISGTPEGGTGLTYRDENGAGEFSLFLSSRCLSWLEGGRPG